MKKLYFLLALLAAIVLSSCEKDLELFNAGTGVNFYFENASDTLVIYSFVYGPAESVTGTISLNLETVGLLSDKDRRINLEQIAVDPSDAVIGVHYEPFPEGGFTIPAGQSRVSIPIVLKRDASLQEKRVTLGLQIKPNKEFPLVNLARNRVKIVFSDQLERPTNWNTRFILGSYGPVKHRFVIETTGEKWDYDYIYNEIGFIEDVSPWTNDNYDRGFCDYLVVQLTRKLDALNAARAEDSLPPLAEEDGTVVSF
jgi:hypothetical protein